MTTLKYRKWMPNLINIAKYGVVGKCPYCKSENTDQGYTRFKLNNQYGWGTIWCNYCKRGYHISRIMWSEKLSTHEKQAPEGINYL